MPGYTGGTTSSTNDGNTFYPIADNHVYAYSYSNWNKANWGKYKHLGAGWNPTGGEKRAFLKFDLSGIDPNYLEKATLRLYHNHTGGGNTAELGVYAVHGPWTEGRGTYRPASAALPGELTWLNQPEIARYPVVYFNPGQGANKWVDMDVTSLVKAWLTRIPNHGMVIKAGENYLGGSESQYGFYSREYEDADKRPHIVLNGSGITQQTSVGISNNTGSLPFFEDFSSGLGNWHLQNKNAALSGGKLYWNTGNFLSAILNMELPMENIAIEFDGYCETNGINVYLHNENEEGYIVILGGWYNKQSGSDIGKNSQNRELVNGKVWESKQWHHYKIVRNGNILEAFCDGRRIFERTSLARFSGKGKLRFDSYGARIGIDNIRIYRTDGQNPVNTGNANATLGFSNNTGSLPIFENFNSGLGNWSIGDKNAAISDGKLYFHTGNSLLGVFNNQIPMENIEIEFDGYTETNGINVYVHNEKDEGYLVIMGGWFNAQSGSDVGKVEENRELINGKVWEPKRWHHYKIIKCGNTLTAYCDGRKIYERNIARKFSGKGKIKFSSWNTRIGIDNIKISKCSGTQSNTDIGNPASALVDGEWEMTCIGDEIFKFKLTLVQYDNVFYGDMVRTNGNERLAKIEGQILPNDRIEFTRSIGNWKQYYTGEISQKSGSRATSFEGMFGFKDQLNNEWYAKTINGSSSNNSVTGQWLIDQSNGYNGSMNLLQDQSGRLTGDAIWNGYLKGTIEGKVTGSVIEFTISYPNGDKGLYKGTLTQNGTRMVNGTVVGNNGVTATWEANK